MINLICDDCGRALKGISDNSIDLIITSPPYATQRGKVYGGIKKDQYNEWFLSIAKEFLRVLKPEGGFFLNIKPHTENGERVLYVYELVIALHKAGFYFIDEFIWTKNPYPGKYKGRFKNGFEPVYHFTKTLNYNFFPYEVATKTSDVSLKRYKRKEGIKTANGSGMTTGFKTEDQDLALPSNHIHINHRLNQFSPKKIHPATYPVELPLFFIKAFSKPGAVILDPFCGSGSTGEAAAIASRDFIGIDNKPEYIELSQKMIEKIKTPAGE